MVHAWHQQVTRAKKSKRISHDGELFASRAEMQRYYQLQLMERAKVISNVRRQVHFPLILPNGVPIKTPTGKTMKCIVDFVYREAGKDADTIEEAKPGFMDPRAELKIAVFEAIYQVKVKITGQEAKEAKKKMLRIAKQYQKQRERNTK